MRTRAMNAALALVFLLGLAGPASAAEQYKIDPAHTSIYFRVSHFGLSEVYGRFNEFKGDFTLGEKPRFRLAVRAESIDTGIEKRDEHLRGPDFFNVKQYPVISFESQSVERKGERFHVTGNLTLHGVTKQVTLELEKNGEGEGPQGKYRAGFSTKHTLKRSGYGMDYMVGPVGDEVTLMISFEGIRQ